MDSFIIRRGIAAQVAMHYVANYEEIGPKSVKELTAMYGCSEATVRSALRDADQLLHSQGRALTVPDGGSAYRTEVTADQRTFVVSTVSRLTAMAHELQRYAASEIAVAPDGARHMFGDITAAVEMLVDVLAETAV